MKFINEIFFLIICVSMCVCVLVVCVCACMCVLRGSGLVIAKTHAPCTSCPHPHLEVGMNSKKSVCV